MSRNVIEYDFPIYVTLYVKLPNSAITNNLLLPLPGSEKLDFHRDYNDIYRIYFIIR